MAALTKVFTCCDCGAVLPEEFSAKGLGSDQMMCAGCTFGQLPRAERRRLPKRWRDQLRRQKLLQKGGVYEPRSGH